MFKGDTWVAIWSCYVSVMLQVAFWTQQPIEPWIHLLEIVLGGYVIHGTVTKSVQHWRNRVQSGE